MKQFIIAFLFSLLSLTSAQAYFFRNYQMEDGLSHNSVWAVMQDSKGFMWFGTVDGLNRFDGKTFKIYKKQADDPLSLGSNFIHYLKEDSKGRILIGTKQGLYLLDQERENFQHVNLKRSPGEDASISYIMEDPDGNIWLACYGQGIYILDANLQVKKHYQQNNNVDGIPTNFIWTLVADYNGVIWLGTDGMGLVRFDPKEERFTKIIDNKTIKINDPTIYSLYCDIDNNIWIGTSGSGLCSFNYRTGKTASYLIKDNKQVLNIKAITAFSDHELIMGSDNGLVKFDRNTHSFDLINNDSSFDNLTDKAIFSIAKDNEGAFWVGTYFGGVNYYSPQINQFSYYANVNRQLSRHNIISSFAEDGDGKIWIGTHDSGLSFFDPKTKVFERTHYNPAYHDVQELLLDHDRLYISLYGKGINILNKKNGHMLNYFQDGSDHRGLINNFINSLFKTSKGDVLFGTTDGVCYLEPGAGEFKKLDRLNGMPIKDMEEDYTGSIWFASHMYGLLRRSADGKWTSVTHNPTDRSSLICNNINCIFQDTKYRMWIGTEGEGLTLFNLKNGKFEFVLNEKSGLPSNIIYAILDDADGNIWISTARGLARIDPKNKAIRTFGYIEDLQKIRYNHNCALRASDNRLYFGGTNGFTVFNPREITENTVKPPVVITGFQIFNKEVVPGAPSSPLDVSIDNTKEIILEYNQSSFNFDFAALSFLSPKQNQYAYMLEGFDQEWNYVHNNNKAFYMNIPAGDYVFRVKAANNDGVWSNEDTKILIQIKRPFWLSNTMVLLYIVVSVGMVTYLIRQNNKRIEARNQEKIYKYQARKEKEIYESKINFFTNIAHEIRTPLSLITAPLESILVSGDGSPQTKSNLGIIERNANRLLELVNQLLDFRKIEEDMYRFNFRQQAVADIVRGIYQQYRQHAELKGVDMQLMLEDGEVIAVVDAEALYKIISNLVSNAIKYAKTSIKINVKLVKSDLIIRVEDDGDGIDTAYLDKIFEPFFQVEVQQNGIKTGSGLGLSLSQSLAIKHGGILTVASEHLKGCVFTLKIPVTRKEDTPLHKEAITDLHTDNFQTGTSDTKQKILVVEDNDELRGFLSNSLREKFTVFDTGNGLYALEIVEKENIDIVISDILMPGMDGLELCLKLKEDPAYSHIPLIILSAKTDTSAKIEGLKKGADVYIEKPFSMEQLKAQINSIIENRNHMRNSFIKSPLQYFKQHTENRENADFIVKLNDMIVKHIADEKFSIDHLSTQFSMSRSNLHRKIKNITGITPNDYIKLIRLNESARILATGKYKINEVCYLVGFNTPSYFSKCFYEQFGKLPKDFVQTTVD